MLEQKLLEELNRFRSINKNVSNLNEQEIPAPSAAPAEDPTAELPPPGGDSAAPAPAPDASGAPAPLDAAAPEATPDTEEVDVTDLVNMTKNIKNDLEASKTDNSGVLQKMDDVFSKLSELEGKLGEMDNVIAKIDALGNKVEQMKPATPVEKLEMRSLDSYPFSQKPNDFFTQKQMEMQKTGKNEYILTKDDVSNYSKEQVANSFNPNNIPDEEQEELYQA